MHIIMERNFLEHVTNILGPVKIQKNFFKKIQKNLTFSAEATP